MIEYVIEEMRREKGSILLIASIALCILYAQSGNEALLTFGIYALGLISLYVFASNTYRRYKMAKYAQGAQTLVFDATPNPGDSLIQHLSDNGCEKGDIAEIRLMAVDLSNEYTLSIAKKIRAENQTANIIIAGSGNAPDKNPDNVNFIKVDKPLHEHWNVIESKDGSLFVWYEPEHRFKNKRHLLPKGAFLAKAINRGPIEHYNKVCGIAA